MQSNYLDYFPNHAEYKEYWKQVDDQWESVVQMSRTQAQPKDPFQMPFADQQELAEIGISTSTINLLAGRFGIQHLS